MKKKSKYLSSTLLFVVCIGLFALVNSANNSIVSGEASYELDFANIVVAEDTATVRFPVKKTQQTGYEDLETTHPIDLKDPSNIQTEVEYDPVSELYLFKTKVGDGEWVTTMTMTPKEYNDYMIKESMSRFFKLKYQEDKDKGEDAEDFSLKDIKVNLGPAEKIFGPGGVRIKTQGYTEVSMGLKNQYTNNPTLSEANRNRTTFDFDQKINMNVKASVGDKVNFDMNYDTEASFDFDSKKLKLAYEGKEDEILKRLEAGNVSMATTNSLINGGTALFGIRGDLQFGKLKISSVISQQESDTKTVSSQGGVQTSTFELTADAYDENRHFFLGFYFRDNYDKANAALPYVNSPITISNIEVWKTNKRGNYDQARNIVAFADLGEENSSNIHSPWIATGSSYPSNKANNLYSEMVSTYMNIRDISQVTAIMDGAGLESGLDYEKIENAQLLSSSEYTYNAQTGYISLRSALQSDEVLAVSYVYKVGGVTYQVGELSADISSSYESGNPASGALILKLLKPVSLSPAAYTWDLMMKNIYSIGATSVQQDKFRVNISYQNDTLGTYTNYISEGDIKGELLLRVMNLDRLDTQKNKNPDGIFDFLDGYTINTTTGRIIFPVVEPFGSHLASKINDPTIASKYVYQELYDMTLTEAQQVTEKNKFKIQGQYRASNNAQINLNATNVAQGSVVVTAGGVTLTEGTQYTVNYISGIVTILDESIIAAGTPISVSLEDQSFFSMQRKTLLGLNLSYDFSKNFTIGGTIMHMYEKPLTTKTQMGDELIKNTLWGLNTSYRAESQWLTNLVNKLPFYNSTAMSSISFTGEFAQLIAGSYKSGDSQGYSYLDDFETSQSKSTLMQQSYWSLASTPSNKAAGASAMFPEATLSNNIEYGKNRAHISWFNISRETFLRRNSSLTPQHIKNNKEELSNHFVREIYLSELYPNRDIQTNEAATISAFNLSYYPKERGMYNIYFNNNNFDSYGNLTNPEKRWGGIMRRMDNKDFETQNYEYVEFWLMDPFVYSRDTIVASEQSGSLYLNLGEISEDVLKDGKKFYENGLPTDGDTSKYEETIWGRVPTQQSTVYAFDNTDAALLARQDVGYNGLSTEDERNHPSYKSFLDYLEANLDPSVRLEWLADQFSPLNDPAGDNYHHYRGSDYDADEVGILDRYKRYNGVEGNTVGSGNESYSTASVRSSPDVEDIDQDQTMNESEAYYQYKVELNPDMDSKYIVDKRTVTVQLSNGQSDTVSWYLFKVPIKENYEKIGSISNFKSIRFMRMYLSGFKQTTFLRFGSLDLVRGDWRSYTNSLKEDGASPGTGTMDVTTINIEENGDKRPVNYIMPPGVSRITDATQSQLTLENEQAMSLKVNDLTEFDARAIYKNTSYDLRKYKRLQMFTHAEDVLNTTSPLKKGDLTVFIRLGSDYRNNYYEYEVPLSITPAAPANGYDGSNINDRYIVWPESNNLDFPLELLKDVKLQRNTAKRQAGSSVSYTTPYSIYDPEKPSNKVSVVGNPSLAEVKVLMIGVRSNTKETKSGEIWINELRLTDFDEEGGWAAQGTLNVTLADLATVNVTGRKETIGFGALDQSLNERRNDDLTSYSVATNIDLGRLLPEKAKVSLPLYYAYSNNTTTPQYNPLDEDVTLKETLNSLETKAEKDSIKSISQDKTTTKNFSLNNVKVNVQSKKPMPYDPANFSVTYSYSETKESDPSTVHDISKDYRLNLGYSYTPTFKPWEPFKSVDSKAPYAKFAKSVSIGYLPNNITITSTMTRNYLETILRDIESYSAGGNLEDTEFVSRSQNFYWNRDLNLSWDFTKNLKFQFQSGTEAEIEEPLFVNKVISQDEYNNWKDEVKKSILKMGSPLKYNQNAKLTYNLPFSNIPALEWINRAALGYDASYYWDKGADAYDDIEVGNTIRNNASFVVNTNFNMVTLYNKWGFLKKVNQKFDGGTSAQQRPGRTNTRQNQTQPVNRADNKKRYEQEITLIPDSTITVSHKLNTKNIKVSAKNENGKTYPVKFKKVDDNSIRITNVKDSAKVKISILPGPDPEENSLYKIAQYSARGLMMLRNFKVNYTKTNENYIYGFRPMVGDFVGQGSTDFGSRPGLGFAFGLDGGEEFVEKLYNEKLLIDNQTNISPATFNDIKRFDFDALIEPIKGLKINLKATHEQTNRTQLQFMYDGMPREYGGSFAMTTIGLSSALRSSNVKNNYSSDIFNQFLTNRDIIASRWESNYEGNRYPNTGFIAETGIGGGTYDPNIGSVNKNSSDVLIPAFLAAYTGKDVNKVGLTAFPSLSSVLPNWNVTYDGILNLIPSLKKKLKAVQISHSYSCTYRVGSYGSYSDWVSMDGNMGFTQNTISGNPTPSTAYNISSVSLTEMFNPLFGITGSLNNGMEINARYNNSRTVSLNISSYQIVESLANELVMGMKYKITNFNRVLGIKDPSKRGFSNDLLVGADFSHKKNQNLIRKIEEGYTQATNGTTILSIKLSADYSLSKALTLKAYVDRVVNTPLVTALSYPVSTTDFGVSIRFTLTQ